MINISKVAPFPTAIASIGGIPSVFTESMSYYECLCWLYNYLENYIAPRLEENQEAVIELQGLMKELKTYVDNYFNNLDVQSYINNKLDEMAQDGTLSNIINQDIFNELNTKITGLETKTGNLANLNTTNKENLVGAINETYNRTKEFVSFEKEITIQEGTSELINVYFGAEDTAPPLREDITKIHFVSCEVISSNNSSIAIYYNRPATESDKYLNIKDVVVFTNRAWVEVAYEGSQSTTTTFKVRVNLWLDAE